MLFKLWEWLSSHDKVNGIWSLSNWLSITSSSRFPAASPCSHGGRGKPLPRDAYFLDNAPKGVPTSVRETAGSQQRAAIAYRVVENLNRRTAEQGTVEYRSEKHCLTASKNFCCSKFLVRYCPSDSPPCGRVPSFNIQNIREAEFHRAGLKS
jgi:hypothetical protein